MIIQHTGKGHQLPKSENNSFSLKLEFPETDEIVVTNIPCKSDVFQIFQISTNLRPSPMMFKLIALITI